MRFDLRRSMQLFLWAVVIALVWPAASAAQTATVVRNVNLRPDSSDEKPSIRLLKPPIPLQLLSPNEEDGYFNVRTAEGQEGWVWGRNIRIESAEGAVAAAAIASTISPDLDKPTPKGGTFNGPSGPCGWGGIGNEAGSNRRKNRTDIPTSYDDVSVTAIKDLPVPVGPKNRSSQKWTPGLRAQYEAFEGIPIRVKGFLVALRPQTGSKEATNCRFSKAAETDWHMALVETAGEGEDEAVVVETTPRIRRNHPKWTKANLNPWLDENTPIRVSGFLFFDTEHRNHLGKYRFTLWEVHPITKIEVFKGGKWVNLDDILM